MAVNLPTTRTLIMPRRWRRGLPLLSGDNASDLEYGMRHLNNEANHAYAYRVQTIASDCNEAGDTEPVYESDSIDDTDPSTIFGPVPVTFGADVSTIRVVARLEQGRLYLRVNDGTTTFETIGGDETTVTTITLTRTITDVTGALGWVSLRANREAGQTFELHAFVIQEVVLTSGELPSA